jgi:SAM-dependent methyltransferase
MARPDIPDVWDRGDPYERYIGRWSRQVAPRFLAWLGAPAASRWLDVGCGTGALTAAILDRADPRSVVGVDPSEGFLETARRRLARARTEGRAELRLAAATALPLRDRAVDVTVSGLVMNFLADLTDALAEMSRVTVVGGVVGGYVWDYGGRMEPIRRFWDAATEIDPRAASLDEGVRFPLCRPESLRVAFETAGLGDVRVGALDIATRFAAFEDYWEPFLGGQGPAPAYAVALDEVTRGRLRDLLRDRLPTRTDGSIDLVARAWAVCGTVPG